MEPITTYDGSSAADEMAPDQSLAFIGSASARKAGLEVRCGCRGTFDNETTRDVTG